MILQTTKQSLRKSKQLAQGLKIRHKPIVQNLDLHAHIHDFKLQHSVSFKERPTGFKHSVITRQREGMSQFMMSGRKSASDRRGEGHRKWNMASAQQGIEKVQVNGFKESVWKGNLC